eukprot:jgi/Psemu1/325479/estExt_fgenesh1_pg.C_2460006
MVRPVDNGIQESVVATPKSSSGPPTTSVPIPPSPGLRPISPPNVNRKQLVQRSSSTAAVVDDEIIVRPPGLGIQGKQSHNTSTPGQRDKNENEDNGNGNGNDNHKSSPQIEQKDPLGAHDRHSLPMRPLRFQPALKREVSTFSLAPETGAVLDREEHQEKLNLWKEREQNSYLIRDGGESNPDTAGPFRVIDEEDTDVRGSPKPPPAANTSNDEAKKSTNLSQSNDAEDDANNNVDDNNTHAHRWLDLTALQEMDRMEEQHGTNNDFNTFMQRENENKSKARQLQQHTTDPSTNRNNKSHAANDESIHDGDGGLSTSSIVSSTCSEFGTVIQMGDITLAQRMAEVDEMVEKAALADEGIQGGKPELPPHLSSSSLLQHDSSLDLPVLEESGSTDNDAATASPSPKKDHYPNQPSDTKTTVATANSTIRSPTKRNPTNSEMVSAVCRRMGTMQPLNRSVRGGNRTNPRSAPTTPRRSDSQAKSSESSQNQFEGSKSPGSGIEPAETKTKSAPPSSFHLRSPGSLARFSLAAHQQSAAKKRGSQSAENHGSQFGNQNRNFLSPRFSTLGRGRGSGETTPLSPRGAFTKTVKHAQKCFTFDNTLDEYGLQDYDPNDDIRNEYNPDERRRAIRDDLVIPKLVQQPGTARLAPRVRPLESSSREDGKHRRSRHVLGSRKQSHSFDTSSMRRSPFRASVLSTTRRRTFLQRSFPAPVHEPDASGAPGVSHSDSRNIYRRNRSNSDILPTKNSQTTIALHSAMELRQPQRIEIEREDALDILALLVEQGIADWETPTTNTPDPDPSTTATMHYASNTKLTGDGSDSGKDDNVRSEKAQSSSSSDQSAVTGDLMTTAKEEKTEDHNSQVSTESMHEAQQNANVSDNDNRDNDGVLQGLIQNFKQWSEEHRGDSTLRNDSGIGKQYNYSRQVELLEELARSHAYAKEMKRASTSASTWLNSIGRGQTTGNHEIANGNNETPNAASTSTFSKGTNQSDGKNENSDSKIDKMDVLTLNATLHSAQLELAEMKQANAMLNKELSECRAEIGRMKSLSRNEQLNKSVLDDLERSSETSSSDTRSKGSSTKPLRPNEPRRKEVTSSSDTRSKESSTKPLRLNEPRRREVVGHPESVSDTGNSYERFFHGVPVKEAKERIESAGQLDVLVLISALDEANETIRRLHNELHKNDATENTAESEPIPLVDIPDIQINKTEPQSTPSTPDSSHRTVNVRMLDAENFVTEWYDLKTLPPPPDHDLQSPIVSAVLEQWTQDRSLHQSLLSWIEHVMRGDDLEGLPPLTISSLDHQVRDGFSMHVLSHLLRRADIHVAVETRAHRNTTYDMSVTVNQKKEFTASSFPADLKSRKQPSLLDSGDSTSEDEWANRFESNMNSTESVAHSAVTETISNLPSVAQTQQVTDPWTQPPQTPKSEYSSFPSRLRSYSGSADTFDENSQHYRQRYNEHNVGATNGTIIGALGGALSGLLSRNKFAASPGRLHQPQTQYYSTGSTDDSRDSSNMLPASLRAQMDLTSSPTSGSTRYHRPGDSERIGSSGLDNRPQEEDEPYHRVVSAPPGRIGVTFVDFRGHATVTDVAKDSPLADWVFPSDVLVAIDDTPVSGMPVRDIVNILSARRDQYRAMRVISSHAMNALVNQLGGPLMEETGEED